MTQILMRVGVLTLVALVTLLVVWSGRRFVESRRHLALAAAPLAVRTPETTGDGAEAPLVRILAFSSDDCAQCHRMQAPALARVREARGDRVEVTEIDAPSAPDLTKRYNVLTVPSTVVLDSVGRAHAVNYGFANTQRLLDQVDGALAQAGSTQREGATL